MITATPNRASASHAPLDEVPPAEPVWDVAKLFPPEGQWTEEEYLSLNPSRLVELSQGSIEVLVMPNRLHQAIVLLLCNLLRAFVAADPAAAVLLAPFAVRLWPGKMRQPDVLYMAGENVARQHETHWEGADLVVEIVSDDDRRRDLDVKRREYARARIPEYWIVDPALRQVAVLTLNGKRYRVAGTYSTGDRAASVLLAGFAVAVDDVFNAR